jgi:hypothetical protein
MAKRYLNDQDNIEFGGAWAFGSSATITPAALTVDTNDYDPTGWRSAGVPQVTGLRLSTDGGNYNLTGLAAPTDGKTYLIFVVNAGLSGNIILTANSGNSVAANRFLFGSNVTLQAEEGIWLAYDQTDSRWREVARAV